MDYYVLLGIKLAVALGLAVILGNGAVVLFNRTPVQWFADDGELPAALRDLGDGGRQRLTSTPWKYIFVALFGLCGLYLGWREPLQYEISVLLMLFPVIEIAVSDAKYNVVPDQFNILLTVAAVGFVGFYDAWWEQLAGAAVGAALILAVYGLGRLLYKKDVIGGADFKYFAAMGLIAGRAGVVCIFVLTELLIALHALILLVRDREALKEHRPMLVYAAAAVVIYFLFLRRALLVLEL
ncbi:MAG: prepilin peptidase [Mogibacterium sp.]|nr:prepilin peptidase [Mogibacterium sp.]